MFSESQTKTLILVHLKNLLIIINNNQISSSTLDKFNILECNDFQGAFHKGSEFFATFFCAIMYIVPFFFGV